MIDLTFWFLGFHDIQEFEFSDSLHFTFQSLFGHFSGHFFVVTFSRESRDFSDGLNKEKP